jgi:hypothetical protein
MTLEKVQYTAKIHTTGGRDGVKNAKQQGYSVCHAYGMGFEK